MDFVYTVTMNYNHTLTTDLYMTYEEAKKNFYIFIREDIIYYINDPDLQEKELAKLDEFINRFKEETSDKVIGTKKYVLYDDDDNPTFYTLQVKRVQQSYHRVVITAWDDGVGWSPDTCEICVIDENEEEITDIDSLNREIWNCFIIPLGLKVVKREDVFDKETEEDPVTRVNGDWVIIRNDIYLTNEELKEKLREFGIAEFSKQYGE